MPICGSADFSCAQARSAASKFANKNTDKTWNRLMLLLQAAGGVLEWFSTTMIAPQGAFRLLTVIAEQPGHSL